MHRNSGLPVVSLLLIASSYFLRDPDAAIAAPESRALAGAYLGFDLNTYPGDAALPVLRETFSFGGYWLSAPPEAKQNTWVGKRRLMLSEKFGFLILYNGPLTRELKSAPQSRNKVTSHPSHPAAA